MMNIVIYSNCHGEIIKAMFENHIYTKNKYKINYIVNYENLDKEMDISHKQMLENCDIFLYQPFNKIYSYSEYDINKIKNILKPYCILLRFNYYRFKGFWFESSHKPYDCYDLYKFATDKYSGIHNSFINFNGDKTEMIEKINNIHINEDRFLEYFKEELENFELIDTNSDVKMYEYFIKNYENRTLFNDGWHPTTLFFYEIFRQLVFKLTGHELDAEDNEFVNLFDDIDLTHWSLPILPQIKKILDIKTPDTINIFYGDKKRIMSIYDYYYIRLSEKNLETYFRLTGI